MTLKHYTRNRHLSGPHVRSCRASLSLLVSGTRPTARHPARHQQVPNPSKAPRHQKSTCIKSQFASRAPVGRGLSHTVKKDAFIKSHAIDLRLICVGNLVTQHPKYRAKRNLRTPPSETALCRQSRLCSRLIYVYRYIHR